MSAFDDEFGLFGDDAGEAERRSTLPARKIASNETIIDDVEPEEARAPRPDRPRRSGGGGGYGGGAPRRGGERYERRDRQPADPWASLRRATALLDLLAKKLVAKPDEMSVELFTDEEGKPVIELVVDPEDLGKVIGRNGRVAHALRTLVRATAETRVSVDILDSEEAAAADGGTQDGGADDDAE
ncbi:MAG TPA: KH domain-containing protein [Candidatus Aquilonibacter sp.]